MATKRPKAVVTRALEIPLASSDGSPIVPAMATVSNDSIMPSTVPNNPSNGLNAPIAAAAHPSREDLGERSLPFSNELYIDREDFREEANKKFKRLVLGKRVRLRNAYVIEAVEAAHIQRVLDQVNIQLVADWIGSEATNGSTFAAWRK